MAAETQIEAGQALDELIALEVMGWDPPRPEREFKPWAWFDTTGWSDDPASREFSTSYEGAQLVLERMLALGWDWRATGKVDDPIYAPGRGFFNVDFLRSAAHGATASTFPLAVSLAALTAVRSR